MSMNRRTAIAASLATLAMPLPLRAQEGVAVRLAHAPEGIGGFENFFLRPWMRWLAGRGVTLEVRVEDDPAGALAAGRAELAWHRLAVAAAEPFSLPLLADAHPVARADRVWNHAEAHVAPALPGRVLIGAHLRGGEAVHARGRRLARLGDFEGVPIIAGNPVSAAFLARLGARATDAGESAAIRALVRRETEAILLPWDRLQPLDLLRHSGTHTEAAGPKGLANALYGLVAGEEALAALAAPVRAALLDIRGTMASTSLARAMAMGDEIGRGQIERIAAVELRIGDGELHALEAEAARFAADWQALTADAGYPAETWLSSARAVFA